MSPSASRSLSLRSPPGHRRPRCGADCVTGLAGHCHRLAAAIPLFLRYHPWRARFLATRVAAAAPRARLAEQPCKGVPAWYQTRRRGGLERGRRRRRPGQSAPDARLVGLRSRPTSGVGVGLRSAREPTARTGCWAVPRRGPKRPLPPRVHTGGETTRGVGGRGRHIKASGLATADRRASPVAGAACFAAPPTATASTAATAPAAVVTEQRRRRPQFIGEKRATWACPTRGSVLTSRGCVHRVNQRRRRSAGAVSFSGVAAESVGVLTGIDTVTGGGRWRLLSVEITWLTRPAVVNGGGGGGSFRGLAESGVGPLAASLLCVGGAVDGQRHRPTEWSSSRFATTTASIAADATTCLCPYPLGRA